MSSDLHRLLFFVREEYSRKMFLYPTETLYAIGVNALNPAELASLFLLKERNKSKAASWLVRSIADIERFAELPQAAAKIAEQFLPGSLTLVLKARVDISDECVASDRTVGFRISSDPVAQSLIATYMEQHQAPLTCTSANVSGAPTLPTVGEILQQFGSRALLITDVIDDGPRKGLASTIVRVVGDNVTFLREGTVSEQDIYDTLQ